MKEVTKKTFNIPTYKEFLKGVKEFRKYEARDPMYKVASFWISHFWGKPKEMAEGLGVLLLTWNQAFYRYGRFDFHKLENVLKKSLETISSFKKRSIESFSKDDEVKIKTLFKDLINALQINSGKKKGNKSPVATVKALHLLAPSFFPLWDIKIAQTYKCMWKNSSEAIFKYLIFCEKNKEIIVSLKKYVNEKELILKLLDEYNYAKFTKKWI